MTERIRDGHLIGPVYVAINSLRKSYSNKIPAVLEDRIIVNVMHIVGNSNITDHRSNNRLSSCYAVLRSTSSRR